MLLRSALSVLVLLLAATSWAEEPSIGHEPPQASSSRSAAPARAPRLKLYVFVTHVPTHHAIAHVAGRLAAPWGAAAKRRSASLAADAFELARKRQSTHCEQGGCPELPSNLNSVVPQEWIDAVNNGVEMGINASTLQRVIRAHEEARGLTLTVSPYYSRKGGGGTMSLTW